MRGTVKKLRNIISETEERLLAVPVRAAAAESWSLVCRDLMRRRLASSVNERVKISFAVGNVKNLHLPKMPSVTAK